MNEINNIQSENKELKEKIRIQNEEINSLKEEFKEINKIKEVINSIKEDIEEIKKIKKEIKDIQKIREEIKDTNNIKEEEKDISIIKEEIKEIKNLLEKPNEINNKIEDYKTLKEDIIILKSIIINKSSIMNIDEYNMIYNEIIKNMKKNIKRIKKIYQATVNGGDPSYFHKLCDNIPNTLTIIKSENNRRFGGFTTMAWESKSNSEYKKDRNAFIFSLDNKKIYPSKDIHHSTQNYKKYGPCFGIGPDIGIEGNPLKDNKLLIFESSYNYNEDKNCLENIEKNNRFKALDYEIFEILF